MKLEHLDKTGWRHASTSHKERNLLLIVGKGGCHLPYYEIEKRMSTKELILHCKTERLAVDM